MRGFYLGFGLLISKLMLTSKHPQGLKSTHYLTPPTWFQQGVTGSDGGKTGWTGPGPRSRLLDWHRSKPYGQFGLVLGPVSECLDWSWAQVQAV